MATYNFIKSVAQDIGTVETTIYTAPVGQTCLLISLNLSNKLPTGVTVSVILVDSDSSNEIYLLKDVPIPQGSTLPAQGRQKIVVSDGDEIKVVASNAASIDAVLSVMEDIN